MNTQSQLLQQAISAAKENEWNDAVSANLQILQMNAEDTGALTRLGVAYLQLNQKNDAKEAFTKVLDLDVSNTLAKKHLQKIKSNQKTILPSFSRQYFIEEPGKTKTTELCRLAGKEVINGLAVGQECELKLKNRYISVESNNQYIGALPEDISFRLAKLIHSGNTYSCVIRSNANNTCSVYIKETFKSPENLDNLSFPINKASLSSLSDIDDEFLLDDDIPVEAEDGFTEIDTKDVEEEVDDDTEE